MRRVMLGGLAPAVVVASVLTGCSATVDSPLPGYSSIVDDDAPLTAPQAEQVRTAGRALTQSMIDDLATRGATVDEDSTETWEPCVAKSTFLHPQAQFNGVRYIADVRFDTPAPVTAKDAKDAVTSMPIQWSIVKGVAGTRDVFSVQIEGAPAQMRTTVTSPCYFLRDTDDRLSEQDTTAVTGFIRQNWAQ